MIDYGRKIDAYGALQDGAVIIIRPYTAEKKNFVPSTFWMEDGRMYAQNNAIGKCDVTEQYEGHPEYFNGHIRNMISEHFEVVIRG